MGIIQDNDSARAWLRSKLGVSRETEERLEQFVALLTAESERQNLIARSTMDIIWARHILDSAQLLPLVQPCAKGQAETHAGEVLPWLDLGTGAGFPGLVIAVCSDIPVVMVESRARRVAFLQSVIDALGLDNAVVMGARLERITPFAAGVISARAFAPLPKLLSLSAQFSTKTTYWLLPKGKNAVNELETLSKDWQNLFHVKHSLTDKAARILVGKGRPD